MKNLTNKSNDINIKLKSYYGGVALVALMSAFSPSLAMEDDSLSEKSKIVNTKSETPNTMKQKEDEWELCGNEENRTIVIELKKGDMTPNVKKNPGWGTFIIAQHEPLERTVPLTPEAKERALENFSVSSEEGLNPLPSANPNVSDQQERAPNDEFLAEKKLAVPDESRKMQERPLNTGCEAGVEDVNNAKQEPSGDLAKPDVAEPETRKLPIEISGKEEKRMNVEPAINRNGQIFQEAHRNVQNGISRSQEKINLERRLKPLVLKLANNAKNGCYRDRNICSNIAQQIEDIIDAHPRLTASSLLSELLERAPKYNWSNCEDKLFGFLSLLYLGKTTTVTIAYEIQERIKKNKSLLDFTSERDHVI